MNELVGNLILAPHRSREVASKHINRAPTADSAAKQSYVFFAKASERRTMLLHKLISHEAMLHRVLAQKQQGYFDDKPRGRFGEPL